MPDWQGVGLGIRFLTEVARLTLMGDHGLEPGRIKAVYMNTSPGADSQLPAARGLGTDLGAPLWFKQKVLCNPD